MPLSLVLIDVNGMKLMNDAFGHMAGDELLVTVAQVLRHGLRGTDVAARIGGDEFVLLLPQTSYEAAERVVARIKAALSKKTVEGVPVSASFGLATKYDSGEEYGCVYRAAEDNMYREKLLLSRQMKADTLRRILGNLYAKSEPERRHSEVVSRLCMEIGREMSLTHADIEELGALGLYHDIGKIAVDGKILNKPGGLEPPEMSEIERHPEATYQILRSFSGMGDIAEYALAHHRRVDGSGYPGLPVVDMPLKSRILSVAEAFEMMTGQYPFRDALTTQQAVEELLAHADSQFDGEVVRVFVERVLPGDRKDEPWDPGEN